MSADPLTVSVAVSPIFVLLPFDLFLCYRNIIVSFICLKSIFIYVYLHHFAMQARLHKGTDIRSKSRLSWNFICWKRPVGLAGPGAPFPCMGKLSAVFTNHLAVDMHTRFFPTDGGSPDPTRSQRLERLSL